MTVPRPTELTASHKKHPLGYVTSKFRLVFGRWPIRTSVRDTSCPMFRGFLQSLNAIFWDIALCSLYANRRFGGTYHHHPQNRNQTSKKPACSRRLATHGLLGAISQKMATFLTTAVRTSKPTGWGSTSDQTSAVSSLPVPNWMFWSLNYHVNRRSMEWSDTVGRKLLVTNTTAWIFWWYIV
jgi:hypothetical protein